VRRIRAILAAFVATLILAASAAPAMASRGDDDFCFWDWTFEWGWFVSCVDDDFDDGFDDGDHRGGGGNSGPG
jgi:hypothetical protein